MGIPHPLPPIPVVLPDFPDNPIVGTSQSNTGVLGQTNTGVAVWGVSNNPKPIDYPPRTSAGVLGEGKNGVHGRTSSASDSGVLGENSGGGYGVSGTSTGKAPALGAPGGAGVWGNSQNANGVMGTSTNGVGIFGRGGAAAGSFDGRVVVNGDISGTGRISAAGNIDTDADLSVRANLSAGSISTRGNISAGGNITVAGDILLTAADCAEEFEVSIPGLIEPGTVMVIDEGGAVRPGWKGYDKRVAGVISGAGDLRPGLILHKLNEGHRVPIAMIGTVNCMVDAQYGPIEIGDLLTTSPTPGHAMKALDPLSAFGAVIGKAIKPLEQGQGLIPILVALQ